MRVVDSTGLTATQAQTITIAPGCAQLHLRKLVVNDNGGTAVATAWTLSAAGPTSLSGTTPVDSGAGFIAGTYALSESGPAGYTASAWSCVGGTQSGSNITVGLGESATCTITNDDNAAAPPPPLSYPVTPSNPSIGVTKSPMDQTIGRRTMATWTITVTNTGNVTLTNVTVSDTEAPGCARTSATLPALASMAPNASVSYTCTLGNVSASFTNVAVATGTPPSGANVSANASAHVTVRVPPKPKPQPVLVLAKVAAKKVIRSGQSVGFLITVRNRGLGMARNVVVCDRLPDGLVFVRARGARFVNGDACWRIVRLPASAARNFSVRVKPVQTVKRKVFVNVATVASADLVQPRVALTAARSGAVCRALAAVVVLPAKNPSRPTRVTG